MNNNNKNLSCFILSLDDIKKRREEIKGLVTKNTKSYDQKVCKREHANMGFLAI